MHFNFTKSRQALEPAESRRKSPARGRAPEAAAVALSDLPPGRSGRVESVDPASPIGRRLLDLGFVPRTLVTVVRRAPLGDPVEYELRGTRLCLRRSEASRVRVRPQ